MKKIKRAIKRLFVISLIIFALITAVSVHVAGSNGYSWYCVHVKNHVQPKCDKSFEFIEKYGGYYIDENHTDSTDDKVIYLTFDAGYENGNVEKILNVLKEQNVPAAFFVLGNLITKNQSLIQRMFDEGHLVCNHTYTHKSMVNKSAEEFKRELTALEDACKELIGQDLDKYYRPPEGRFDEASLKYAQEMGYRTVFWSFAYADWDNNSQISAEKAKSKILENIHNGEVMLLHPTSSTNAEILDEIIATLKSQGYRFGTLDELCTN